MDTIVLLDLMGGVALLLWGLHMVRSGILRAFGPDLRHLLSKTFGNRFAAFGAGVALTALLQSSTATALMTCSFASEGMVGLVPALAIMLGANVGTTLIVQVFSFNVAAVAPVLFVIGLVAFRGGARTRIKDLGRVAIGLGLMLLALHILLDTLAPAENAPSVRVILQDHLGQRACIVSDLSRSRRVGSTLPCPRCRTTMHEVVSIAPVAGEPGPTAYECPNCGYVTSVLEQPKDAC
jgi:phosphate:Na+ symporter